MTEAFAERVVRIVAEQLGLPDSEVKPRHALIADLGADSLDTIELVMEFECEWCCEIPDHDAERIVTVQDIIDYGRARGATATSVSEQSSAGSGKEAAGAPEQDHPKGGGTKEGATPASAADVQRLRAECDAITELNHARWLALENVRLLAARHRKEEWAQHMLRFCEEADCASRTLRATSPVGPAPASAALVQRLREAIEGECDGLDPGEEAARNILAYLAPALSDADKIRNACPRTYNRCGYDAKVGACVADGCPGPVDPAPASARDAVYRAMDLASMLAASVGMNDRGGAQAYSDALRSHLMTHIVDARAPVAPAPASAATTAEALAIFHRWAISEGMDASNDDDGFISQRTQAAWDGWCAARASAPVDPAPASAERAWLIESATFAGPRWWGFNWEPSRFDDWCQDANKAVRFARREDAEAVRLFLIDKDGFKGHHPREKMITVTEHEWLDAASPVDPAPASAVPADKPGTVTIYMRRDPESGELMPYTAEELADAGLVAPSAPVAPGVAQDAARPTDEQIIALWNSKFNRNPRPIPVDCVRAHDLIAFVRAAMSSPVEPTNKEHPNA